MKKLPLGIQTFQKLREDDYLYVDKTEHIHRLITQGQYYFLSRPRRFGKSLTASTIKAIFEGQRALFEGLWIENNWNWEKIHPVVHIPFNEIDYQSLGLEEALMRAVSRQSGELGISLSETTLPSMFRELILKASEKGKVVLLIDEYDKPIIDYIEKEYRDKAREHQRILKAFYSVIKSSDPYIELLFITGVSKFSRVSIFSDLNNLEDITMHPAYATLTGYTQQELEHNFADRIELLLQQYEGEHTRTSLLDKVREWYNGYTWDGKRYVYNPFSILNFFSAGQFHEFWFKTGAPTFLVKYIQELEVYDFSRVQVSGLVFENYDLDNLDIRSLLFQTGYITIKAISPMGLYTLGYPNREVEEAMYGHLIAAYNHRHPADSIKPVLHLYEAFMANDLPQVATIVNSIFKDIPSLHFAKQSEFLYHALLHMVFRYLGIFIQSEVHTSDGRIDAVVTTPGHIYILEFKLDESAEAAVQQILEKDYAAKYRREGKPLTGIGINFSSGKKAVEGWKVVELT